jgi:peptidoglycan hydrolase-like protein with peptidoglycan-binding domain
LQKRLNALGFNCGVVDGAAGKKFTAAVIAYQKANGCTADGEITARHKTWQHLLEII